MYILGIDYENARWNGKGRLSLAVRNRKVRKSTILAAGRASREMLRLAALACSGVRFVPRLVAAPANLLAEASAEPLRLESVHARHAPYDRHAGQTAVGAYGVIMDAGRRADILGASEFRLVPEQLEKYKSFFGSGNTPRF